MKENSNLDYNDSTLEVKSPPKIRLLMMNHAVTGEPCLMVMRNPKPSFVEDSLKHLSRNPDTDTTIIIVKATETKTLYTSDLKNPKGIREYKKAIENSQNVQDLVIFERPNLSMAQKKAYVNRQRFHI